MTTPFWLNNPTILFDKYSLTQIWPTPSMDPNKKLNAITRMVILMSFVGFLITLNKRILITCIITLIAIVVLQHIQQGSITQANFNKPQKEGFEMLNERQLDQLNSTKPTNTNTMSGVVSEEQQKKWANVFMGLLKNMDNKVNNQIFSSLKNNIFKNIK